MGKRYHCDYCDKTMVATPSILRTHNSGLVHQKFVHQHYQQFKDPETILSEEANKRPCLRYAGGNCQFAALCRYSHYTQEELNALRQLVATRTAAKSKIVQPSFEDLYQRLQQSRSSNIDTKNDETVLYDQNGVTYIFPWKYNEEFKRYPNLPQSLKPMEIGDFVDDLTEWG